MFGSRQADRIVQKWLSTEGDHQISIISDLPHALSLPWELLHSEQGYLVMRTQEPVSILRRLPQSESTASSTPFEPPLRVLLVTARPQGTGFIDPRGIARELLDEVQGQIEKGTIELEFLRPPTLKALRQRLRDGKRQVHVLHFDGHGTFEEKMDRQDEHLLDGGVTKQWSKTNRLNCLPERYKFSSVAARLVATALLPAASACPASNTTIRDARTATRFCRTFQREYAC